MHERDIPDAWYLSMTSFGPKTLHEQQGAPTDLLWSKNVTLLNRAPIDLLVDLTDLLVDQVRRT